MGIYEETKKQSIVLPQDLSLEETKLLVEMTRNLATLSTAIILVLVTFQEKIIKGSSISLLVIVAFILLLLSVLFAIIAQGLLSETVMAKAAPALLKKENPIQTAGKTVAYAFVLFILGLTCIVVYGVAFIVVRF